MPKKKEKLFSKKNSITFQLVHRSQHDPLAADENAPQYVLKDISKKKNKGEEHKYGIFFDDEYNYLQHLRSVRDFGTEWKQIHYKTKQKPKKSPQQAKVILPSSVFESEVQESVGLLNKAAPIHGPRPELDPDIVAAMDDDFDFDNPDNQLEDNFIEIANQPRSECTDEYESKLEDDDFLYGDDDFKEVETKSRFTDYSLTSSVMRRNEQLTLLDNHFENMFKMYDDAALGSLASEEIEGTTTVEDELLIKLTEKSEEKLDNDHELKERILMTTSKDLASEEEMEDLVVNQNTEKWDCESILSTYSNLYNHPAKICEPKNSSIIKISRKTGIPCVDLRESKLTARNLSLLDELEKPSGPKSIISRISELSIRSKNETPEEKRKRKHLLKDYRRERREERKANTQAFKEEKMRQEKILLNLRNNLMGKKIL